jgi:hypothetical protein
MLPPIFLYCVTFVFCNRFDDVQGVDEAKAELEEIVE